MDLIRKWISKYTGTLRSLKAVYTLNNLFHLKQLKHHKSILKNFGIRKTVFTPIGKQDLKEIEGKRPWLDEPDALSKLESNPEYSSFSEEIQQAIKQFVSEGMLTLKSYYSKEEVQNHWAEIERLKKEQKIGLNYTGKKFMQAHKNSSYIHDQFFKNKELIRLLSFLMGKKIIPFHTIHFEQGSEQKAHSDSIHMTTEPEGYLIAAWTALEQTDEDNGTLFYYPGSHTLPYITCQDYDSGNSKWLIGDQSYARYEDKIEELIESHNLKPVYFNGEPGDVFIWHANLLHGGMAIHDASRTRKSMVAHYFCEDVICYHEISQRLALIDMKEYK